MLKAPLLFILPRAIAIVVAAALIAWHLRRRRHAARWVALAGLILLALSVLATYVGALMGTETAADQTPLASRLIATTRDILAPLMFLSGLICLISGLWMIPSRKPPA